jgi:mono/diheme cytochrome c family protein
MRKALRFLKYSAVAAAVTGVAAFSFLYARRPDMAPPQRISIQRTPERLARGAYIYNLADCDGCHGQRDFSRFGGPVLPGRSGAGTVFPKELGLPGRVAPPNITPDLKTGIGSWTDGEKIRAIRDGVDKNGRTLFPMMPYEHFRYMSDEDVQSLVAYLDSLPPVIHEVPPTELDFPVSLLVKNTPKPAGSVSHPNLRDQLTRGKYLVNIAGCQGCHTATLAGGEKMQFGPGMTVVSANISPDLTTGIGRWSEQDFVDKFTQYRDYVEHGSPKATGPESFTVMPWLNLCQLPDDDLRAIYSYIRTLPPVFKAVETHPGYSKPARTTMAR